MTVIEVDRHTIYGIRDSPISELTHRLPSSISMEAGTGVLSIDAFAFDKVAAVYPLGRPYASAPRSVHTLVSLSGGL
jgi:hypothetical protein